MTTDRQEMKMDVGSMNAPGQTTAKPAGTLRDYLALARFDHFTKHIFIVPGIVLAYLLRGGPPHFPVAQVILGLIAAICIASANYVINEYLDREFDKFHPTKSKRSAVQRELRGGIVAVEWLALVAVGLGCAWLSSFTMFLVAAVFAM